MFCDSGVLASLQNVEIALLPCRFFFFFYFYVRLLASNYETHHMLLTDKSLIIEGLRGCLHEISFRMK